MSDALVSVSGRTESLGVDRIVITAEQLRRDVPGGIGTYTNGLIAGLLQMERSVRPELTLFASAPKERPDPLSRLGLTVQTGKLKAPIATELWNTGRVRVKIDGAVAHATSFATPRFSVPTTMMVHDLAWRVVPEAFTPRGRKWHEAALHKAARHIDTFVVPSITVQDALCAAGVGISADRVHVIPEGADHLPPPDDLGAVQLLRNNGVTGDFLLSTGTFEPRKNLVGLATAYASMRAQLPEPWPLVIVGPKGWGDVVVPGAKGVTFVGVVTPAVLAALYRRARCVAYVPFLEGFGLPVVEAMHAGTPVVASDVPSAGDATLRVDPHDLESIADGLLRGACEESLRDELCRKGRSHVSALTWASCAAQHVKLWAATAKRA